MQQSNIKSKEKEIINNIFVYKQCYFRYDIVILSQQNNKKIHPHDERKKMSLLQKDRVSFQKMHQIARIVDHNDRVTRYAIPLIIKWLKTMELMEKMK